MPADQVFRDQPQAAAIDKAEQMRPQITVFTLCAEQCQ